MNAEKIYTTAALPPQRQLGAWQDFMQDVYYSVEIRPRDDERVFGELKEVSFEPMRLSSFRANEQRCFRHQNAARHDLDESFVFIFPVRGAMAFEHMGRCGTAHVGSVVLLNSAHTYSTNVPDGAANVTIKIPSSILRPRVAGIDDLCGRAGVANGHLTPVVRHLGTQLLALGETSHGARLRDNLLDLICLMMETGTGTALDGTEHASLSSLVHEQLTAYLEAHYRDPGLSPAAAAQANRISLRYLHKVFQLNGTTFGRALLCVRLENAFRQLAATPAARRNIAQIAYGCGFASQAHFSVKFRACFGFPPRETPPAPQAASATLPASRTPRGAMSKR